MEPIILELWRGARRFRYLRESPVNAQLSTIRDRHHMGPLGTMTLMYEVIDGLVTRHWWLLQPQFADGIDPSPFTTKYIVVDPATITPGQASRKYEAKGKTWGPLSIKPVRLLTRWEHHVAKHPVRVIRAHGLRRFVRGLRPSALCRRLRGWFYRPL